YPHVRAAGPPQSRRDTPRRRSGQWAAWRGPRAKSRAAMRYAYWPRWRALREYRSRRPPGVASRPAQEILLAELDPVVAQDVIRRSDVKENVRQHEIEQIGHAGKGQRVAPDLERDDFLLGTV